jgi:capsular polysaccharide biosynthesis protein/tetratricopeptide (TPR) repeat protein
MPAPNHKAPLPTQAPIAPAGDADGAFEAALTARRQGDWQGSLGHLQSAIKLAPDNARYHAEAGAALFMLDRHAEAASAYERALAIDPKHLASLNNLGVIYSLGGRFKEAEALLQQSVAIDPKQFEAWLNLCSAVEHIDGDEGAVVGYATKAVALRPRDPSAYMYLGKAHLRNGAPLSALDAYSIVLRLGGNHADCHFRIGLCHLALEHVQEATNAFQEALEADPCHMQTYHALAELLQQRSFDDLPAAEEACRRALKHEDKSRLEPDLPYLFAQILFAQDRCEDAVIWYRESVERKRILANKKGEQPPNVSDLILAEVTTADHWAATHGLPDAEVLPAASVLAPPIRRFGMPPKTWSGSITVPAAYVSEIHNATILPGNEPILVDGEHTAIFDRFKLLKDPYNFLEQESIPLAAKGKILVAAPKKSKSRISTGIFFLGHYWQNYAHWIMEHLPRLLLLDKLPQYDGLPILINEGLYPQQLESLQALCGNRYPIQTLPRDHRFEVERLIYPSNLTASINMRFRLEEEPTPNDVSFHPEAIRYLRDRLIPGHKTHLPGTRRLWISRTFRRGYGSRRLANETEIEAHFLANGFERILPETMSFRQQVETFAEAGIIAGASGAGMINMVFAPPTAKILMFVKDHPLTHYYYFANVAQALDQHLMYVTGMPMPNFRVPIIHADFHVELATAKRALNDILNRRHD